MADRRRSQVGKQTALADDDGDTSTDSRFAGELPALHTMFIAIVGSREQPLSHLLRRGKARAARLLPKAAVDAASSAAKRVTEVRRLVNLLARSLLGLMVGRRAAR